MSERSEFAYRPAEALHDLQRSILALVQIVSSRHDIPLDAAIVTVAPRGQRAAYGWFGPDRWLHRPDGCPVHELVIVAEHLDRDVGAVATTTIHELVHLWARLTGVQDTSRQGRWHNERFGAMAIELGLLITPPEEPTGVRTIGLRHRALSEYAKELADLKRALTLVRTTPPSAGSFVKAGGASASRTTPSTSLPRRVVTAACQCRSDRRPRIIRVPVASWVAGGIECRVCGAPFVEQGALN